MTPLQVWLDALFALLIDARDELSAEEWAYFVSIACDRIGRAAAREIVAEALRATGEATDEAA